MARSVLTQLQLFSSPREVLFTYTVCGVRQRWNTQVHLDEAGIRAAHTASEPIYVTLLGARNMGFTRAVGLDNGPPMLIRMQVTQVDAGHEGESGGVTCLGNPFIGGYGAPWELVPSVAFRFMWDPVGRTGKFNYVPPTPAPP